MHSKNWERRSARIALLRSHGTFAVLDEERNFRSSSVRHLHGRIDYRLAESRFELQTVAA